VVGASTGYGLASRVVATFAGGADTVGVAFEKPATGGRTATAGWYNTLAFERAAQEAGHTAESIVGDAFSDGTKAAAVARIRDTLGSIDCIVYSLASPRRTHPETGERFTGAIKPIGAPYSSKTVNVWSGEVSDITIGPATDVEIAHSVAVMGGEDWSMWIDALISGGVLADGATAIAYSYIGPDLTRPVYREGTIGRAKDHLEATARHIDTRLAPLGGRAVVSVNKAVVTQSSAAIPVVPLYISLLYRVMKTLGNHERCLEQIHRLFSENLVPGSEAALDDRGRIRMDRLELSASVQGQVQETWPSIQSHNLEQLTDIVGYRNAFLRLFGFGYPDIDYDADVDPAFGGHA